MADGPRSVFTQAIGENMDSKKEVWWDPTSWTPETRAVVIAICAAICLVAQVCLSADQDDGIGKGGDILRR